MENVKAGRSPVMQLSLNSSAVTVMFSGSDSGTDIKGKVRDILTEAYEERFQKEFMPCGQPS